MDTAPATPAPEPPLLGKRLQRFCWLLHFQHISKLLEFAWPPVLNQYPDLQRARSLLFDILDQQVSGHGAHAHMRTASTRTWLDSQYQPLLARGVSPWDPQFDGRPAAQQPNSASETFPEGGQFWAGQPVTDLIRHQRLHILDGMRRIIYASRHVDRAGEVAKVEWGLEKLWHYLMRMMGHAQYFVYGHDGKRVYDLWTSLSTSCQADFIQQTLTCSTLMTGGSEIEAYVKPSNVRLLFESYVFTTNFLYLARGLEKFTVFQCETILRNRPVTDCFSLVPTPTPSEDQLSEGSCPVCLDPYDHALARLHSPEQRGTDAEKLALWSLPDGPRVAIKTLCQHCMCLTCLKAWLLSGAGNSERCPLCRAELKGQNPAPHLFTALKAEIMALQRVEVGRITARDLSRRLLAAYETFTTGLPFSKEDLDEVKHVVPAGRPTLQDVYDACRNVTAATAEEFQSQHRLIGLDAWFSIEMSCERLRQAEAMACMEPACADTWPSLLSDLRDRQAQQWQMRARFEMRQLGATIQHWTMVFAARYAWLGGGLGSDESDTGSDDVDPVTPSGDSEESFPPSPTPSITLEAEEGPDVSDSDSDSDDYDYGSDDPDVDQADSEDEDFLPIEHDVLGLHWDGTWGSVDRGADEGDSEEEF